MKDKVKCIFSKSYNYKKGKTYKIVDWNNGLTISGEDRAELFFNSGDEIVPANLWDRPLVKFKYKNSICENIRELCRKLGKGRKYDRGRNEST